MLQQKQMALEKDDLQNAKTESLQKRRIYLEKANFEMQRNLNIQKKRFFIEHSHQEQEIRMRRTAADNTTKTMQAKDKLNRYLENQLEEMEWSMSRRLEHCLSYNFSVT